MADNKDKKVLNVPAIRFPEFTGEWKSVHLEEVAEFQKQRISTTLLNNSNYISTENILQNFEGIQSSSSIPANMNVIEYQKGDILLSNIRPYLKKVWFADRKGGCSADVFVLRGDKCNQHFLYYVIASDRFINYAMSGAKGVKMPRGDKRQMEKYVFSIPTNTEQRKIAKFLSMLDERIRLQNKIIEKLETLIKGITDVLLDNPLWEKVFLHSFMQFYPSNSLSWEQLSYEDGKIRNLHYGLIHNFSTKGITANSLPMILPHNEPKQFTLCKVGDVAFADASEDTNEIGKAVEFISVHPSGTVCGLHTIHGRDIKNKTFVGFKGFAFNSRYFHDQIKRLAQGSKVFSITASNLLSCYIYVPNIAKQEMITKLLHAYEEKIMANKTLLDKYEMQRAYLLQRMFI